MTKRFLPAVLLLFLIACETAPPTGRAPDKRDPFGGAVLRPVAPELSPSLQAAQEQTGQIETVDPSTLTVTGVITFDEFTGTTGAGLNFDGVVEAKGATFAERFAGQALSFSGDFDVLAGTPSSPLTLQVGAAQQNLNILFWPPSASNVIDGLGPKGFPNNDAIGEGAIAVRFDADQSELGFDVVGANSGSATLNFFRRDGSLIGTVVLSLGASEGNQALAFRRAGAVKDIAGLSIHNDDGGGIGYDNFRIDDAPATTQVVGSDGGTVAIQQFGKPVAGINIPQGTFNENVIVTVQFVPLTVDQRCHDFLLGQFGRCLDITAQQADGGGKADLNNPVTVGLCLDAHRSLDLFKFEDRQGNVIALEQTAASFLDCSGFDVGSAKSSNPLYRYATRLWRWLAPKPLMAAHTGFGGIVPGPKLSFFTWAGPIQISFAGLGVNVRRSGKDAFTVSGTFNLGVKGFRPYENEQSFNPAAEPVIVGFGKYFQTIPSGSFKPRFGRFVYTAPLGTTTGVLGMEIRSDGGFTTSGAVPTEGGTLPAFRPFSLQIGHRTQGAGLKCGSDGKCVRQEL